MPPFVLINYIIQLTNINCNHLILIDTIIFKWYHDEKEVKKVAAKKKTGQLKNRRPFHSYLKNELWDSFDELAKETRLTKSTLLDEAVELLLKKYGKDIVKKEDHNE